MKDSRLKQALYYQLNYFGWSSLYVYGIAIAVIVTIRFFVTVSVSENNVVAGIGGVGFFHLLIMGIAGIREDLKFYLQHGIGRRTTFFSHLYGSLICGAGLGLFCVVFSIVTGYLFGLNASGSVFTIQSFFVSWMLYTISFFFAWQIGALISLIYYRLNRMQQVVFSVIAVAAIIFTFSGGIRHVIGISGELDDIIPGILENPLDIISPVVWALLLFGILAAIGNYFLLRYAQVKE